MCRRFPIVPGLLSLVALLGMPRPGSAGVPNPAESVWPHHVVLVGTNASGVPDPIGTMHVEINHYGGRPYGSPIIVLYFSASPGVEFCMDQGNPAVIADCATRTVRTFGDNFGKANLIVTGHVDRNFDQSHAPSAQLYVDGVLFGTIPVASYDEDGFGVSAADNSLFQQDLFSGQYWERSDFNGDTLLTAADLSVWLTAYFGDGSKRGSTTGNVCV